ncbi:hypothetical protein LTR97_009479 [Elasticomyces elasticus]|uniref:F-box domain-containing protein n=1 Tax=Elasticomyces elasticus TaxID=574655 RepID=A0AAN7VWS5_9PEZI|nr:hypothetical protein LTR97_009479 [Elasticomyces elasticus]
MAPKAYILELPTEMLVQIADSFKTGHDLLAFRLTCQSLEKASHDTFATKYFAARTHLFTRYGLQALADIAKHPSLGRKVKKIEIVVKELCRPLFDDLEPVFDVGPSFGSIPRPVPTNQQKLAAAEAVAERAAKEKQRRVNWETEADALADESQVSTTLNKIFTSLASVGASLELDVNGRRRESYYDTSLPYGTKNLLALIGNDSTENSLHDGKLDYAFRSILTAMARTGVKCHAFTVGEIWEGDLRSPAFEVANAPTNKLQLCLGNLTKLRLYFGYQLPLATVAEEAIFVKFAQACVSLEELHLGWNAYEAGPVWRRQDALVVIAGAFSSRRLRSICLSTLCADTHSYIELLEARRQSLKKLTLDHPHVSPSQCWSTILRWILQHGQLDYLKLDTLALQDPWAVMGDDDDKETFVLEGDVEGVKEQLRVLLPKMSYLNYD